MASCWTGPSDTQGSLVAYRFGLDKTGAIRGKPLVTARRLMGDREAQRRYEEAASAALSRAAGPGDPPWPVYPAMIIGGFIAASMLGESRT